MDAFVREPDDVRRGMLQEAQARIGLSPASIEKDLWVCLTLRELFGLPEWGPHLIFKGGTSLSKAWKLIERFSEDIDVVIGQVPGTHTLNGSRRHSGDARSSRDAALMGG